MRFVSIQMVVASVAALMFLGSLGADEKTREALRYKPKQADVEYEQPTEAEIELCTLTSAKEIQKSGFIVRGHDGQILRLYLNTNSDQNLDRWSYFKDGIEVYCDIDSNYDGKADQFRWYGTAGTRWGEDTDGDGAIDRWLAISAEEVSSELVAAIRDQDEARFKRLVLSENEIKALNCSDQLKEEIRQTTSQALTGFSRFASSQTAIKAETQWLQFGGIRPSTVADSVPGVNAPLTVYDNVAAVVVTGEQPSQLALGTLIKIGECWRVMELPQVVVTGQPIAVGNYFFRPDSSVNPTTSVVSADHQADFEEYNRLTEQLETAREKDDKKTLATINDALAGLLTKFYAAAQPSDKSDWIRQFADMIGGAYQNGEYPDGLKKLNEFIKTIDSSGTDPNDLAYAYYRMISAQSSVELMELTDPKAIDEKHKEHLQRLTKFVERFTKSEFVPEAMYQLATSAEISNPEEASAWYARIAKEFPESPFTAKAQGAYTRLNAAGRSVELQGKTLDNQDFRLSGLKGKVVVIHYWASWAGTHEIDELRRLHRKYAADGVEIVGIGVDDDPAKTREFLKENAMPWTQLANDKGLDGLPAVQLGISLVPSTILVGKDGLVVDSRVNIDQLDASLRTLVKGEETAQKPSPKK